MFECSRCHYSVKYKCFLLRHLNRKNICESIYSNDTIEEIKLKNKINVITDKYKYKCEYCDKVYTLKKNLYSLSIFLT